MRSLIISFIFAICRLLPHTWPLDQYVNGWFPSSRLYWTNISIHVRNEFVLTVSGQNTICVYIIWLEFIQLNENEQNDVCNNWSIKSQPAVMLQNWLKCNFPIIEYDLQIHNPDKILRSLTYHTRYFYKKIKKFSSQADDPVSPKLQELLHSTSKWMECVWLSYIHWVVNIWDQKLHLRFTNPLLNSIW